MVYEKLDLLKIKPDKFLVSMNKNGMIYSEDLLKLQTIIEGIDNNNNDIDDIVNKLIKIFGPFKNYDIDYTYYIVIFKSLTFQQIKNFYRFFLIKWNVVKNSYDWLQELTIKYDMEYIIDITNKDEITNIVAEFFADYVEMGDFYFLFFINTFHEYLLPNIR
jgi:hypothetical protein